MLVEWGLNKKDWFSIFCLLLTFLIKVQILTILMRKLSVWIIVKFITDPSTKANLLEIKQYYTFKD